MTELMASDARVEIVNIVLCWTGPHTIHTHAATLHFAAVNQTR